MPVYNVTGPDGKSYRVKAKEGQTQQDANRYIFDKYYPEEKVDLASVSNLARVVPKPAEDQSRVDLASVSNLARVVPKPAETKPKFTPEVRAKPSVFEQAIEPITSYPEALQKAAEENYQFAQEGVAQLQEPGFMPKVKGAGKIALGLLGAASAPVEAAIETVAAKPLEQATGIPATGTEVVAAMALPFGSKAKVVREGSKEFAERTGVDVLEATAAGQAEKAAREQVIKSTLGPTVEELKPKGIASKPIEVYQNLIGKPALEFIKQSPISTTAAATTGVLGMEALPEDAPVQDKAMAFALSALAGFGASKGGKEIAKKIPVGSSENVADAFSRMFIDNYGLPQDYLDVKQNAKMFRNQMSSDFVDLTKDVAKLSEEERRSLYYILQGEELPIKTLANLSEKARETITKYGQKMVDVGLLSPETFEKNAATYLRREYRENLAPEGVLNRAANKLRLIGSSLKPRGVIIDVPKEKLDQYVAEGWERFGESKGDKIRIRRQLTPEERKAKGEIDDAAYAISRTGQLMSNDIAAYKMYDDISKMDEFVSDQPVEGWVQMSSDKIRKTNIPKYGNLAGKYVSPEVANDLRMMQLGKTISNFPVFKQYLSALRAWKAGKTALNPAVHMNNVVSNFMIYDLSGSDWKSLGFAANELRKGKDSDLYQQADKLGVFDAGFSSQELGREGKQVLDELEKSRPAENVLDAALKVGNAGWEKTGGKIIDAYQGEDSIFRFGIFVDRIRAGMSPEDAAKEAKKWLIDYEINAPAINFMRNTTHPFIAYSYRAIPLLAESALLRPWKYAKWAALGYGLNEYGEYESPGRDIEAERRMLPDYLKGTMFGVPGAPATMIKLPSKAPEEVGPEGKVPPSMYLDVQRFLPAGDVFSTTEAGKPSIPLLPKFLQPGGPITDAANIAWQGRDPFTGQDLPGLGIGETPSKALLNDSLIKFNAFYKSLLPNLPGIPGTPATEKFERAAADSESVTRTKLTLAQAALQTFGIKVTPVEIEKLEAQQIFAMEREIDKVEKDFSSKLRRFEQNLIDEKELDQHLDTLLKRTESIFEKYNKRIEGPKKEEPEAEPEVKSDEAPSADQQESPDVIPFTGPDGQVYNVKIKPGQTEADVEKYIMGKYYSAEKKGQGGLITSGNIDVSKLPAVRNPDGSYSTVRSMGIEMDGKFYLIPTVINGRVVSDDEAIKFFEKTGRHLGIFGSQADSDAYAKQLSEAEAKRIGKAKGGPIYSHAEQDLLRRYSSR
jgi:hypothetical protein